MKVFISLVGLIVLSAPLSAVLITLDPDDFASGADISTASPFVTLSSAGGGSGLDGKVYTAVSSLASTGNKIFANSRVSPIQWLNSDTNGYYLRADFIIPTDHVMIDIIGDAGNDYPSLWFYTASGVLEKRQSLSPLGPGQIYTFNIQQPAADILYVRIGGWSSINSTVLLDNLRFEVPEPGAGLIFLSGLLLFKGKKR